eukprot:14728436-Alexandrium_andersonii.AAC.1
MSSQKGLWPTRPPHHRRARGRGRLTSTVRPLLRVARSMRTVDRRGRARERAALASCGACSPGPAAITTPPTRNSRESMRGHWGPPTMTPSMPGTTVATGPMTLRLIAARA